MRAPRAATATSLAARWAFPVSAAAILGLCLWVTRSALFAESPEIGALGVTFDLTVSIPFLYYLFVVRARRAAAITLAPVFVVGLFAAEAIVPAGHQQVLDRLALLAIPLEALVVGFLVVRGARALRHARTAAPAGADRLERLELGLREAFGESRAIEVLLSELAFAWYGIFSWGRRAVTPPGAMAFTCHRRSGWGAIVGALVLLVVTEGLAAHLLLQQWSVRAAWIWTALDLYAILWFLGDFQALRLRPHLLRPGSLELRFGLRWRASVPLDRIERVERITADPADWKRRGSLKLALLEPPDLEITLREPVTFQGLMGLRRQVSRIGLLVDDSEELERLLGASLAAPGAVQSHDRTPSLV